MSRSGAGISCDTERQIRAVVFDFDGTLVDSNAIKRQAYDAAFESFPSAAKHVAIALTAHPDRDRRFIIEWVVKQLTRQGIVRRVDANRLTSAALRKYSSFCRSRVGRARDFPAVAATLRVLGRKYRLAVNSGTRQTQLRQLVRARKWGIHCELVFGSPFQKLRNLERIAGRFKLKPDQIVLVGDSLVDADAAAQFGCAFVHARHRDRAPSLHSPNSIRSFRDLPRAIARLER